mgnify:CR=1 FL=1
MLKKVKPSVGFEPVIRGVLRQRNTCAIGCAKKTVENVFNMNFSIVL